MKESFTRDEVLALLIKERKRAVEIAHEFHDSNHKQYESRKAAGSTVAFVSENIANECRLVGNAISGLNAISSVLGETIESVLKKEYLKIWKS